MPAICDINMPFSGLYGKQAVYETNIFHDVQFIHGMP